MNVERMKKILLREGLSEGAIEGVISSYESELGFVDDEVKDVLEMYSRVGGKGDGDLKAFALVYITEEYKGSILRHGFKRDLADALRREIGTTYRKMGVTLKEDAELYT